MSDRLINLVRTEILKANDGVNPDIVTLLMVFDNQKVSAKLVRFDDMAGVVHAEMAKRPLFIRYDRISAISFEIASAPRPAPKRASAKVTK